MNTFNFLMGKLFEFITMLLRLPSLMTNEISEYFYSNVIWLNNNEEENEEE